MQQPTAAPRRAAGELPELRGDVVHGFLAAPRPHPGNLGLHAERQPAGGCHHATRCAGARAPPAGVRSEEVTARVVLHLERFVEYLTGAYGHDRLSSVVPRDVTGWRDHRAGGLGLPR